MRTSLIFISLISTLTVSCNKDETSKATVSLSATTQTVTENAGTTGITVSLAAALSTDVKISYTLSGTAIENGDYEVSSDSTLTITAGSTSASLSFTIFDDSVVEDDKTIGISFSSTSVNLSNSSATITITDNDTDRSSEGLNTDLTWDGGTMVDLDLYYANNVTISNNSVEDYSIVSSSANTLGFESILLSNDADDGEYYIVVGYASGDRKVKYTLTYNGPSITDEQVTDSLSADDSGYAVFWGPVTKSGSSYSRMTSGSSSWDLKEMEPHLFKGKLKK